VIHALLDNREAISRSVDITPTGIRAHTRSDDPQVAAWIKQHVASMKARVENNDPIRLRDPLFAAVFQNAADMRMDVEYLEDGVKVVQDGATPCAQALAKAHAEVVSGFVDRGRYEVWANHAVPEACMDKTTAADSSGIAYTSAIMERRGGGGGGFGHGRRHHQHSMQHHNQRCGRVSAAECRRRRTNPDATVEARM
jgi:hypothetical protein